MQNSVPFQESKIEVNCCKKDFHCNLAIEYFCLQDCCSEDRLLCRKCVNENHRKHKIGRIDKLIPPLSRMNMNSFSSISPQIYEQMTKMLQAIIQEWQKMNQIFYDNMFVLKKSILFQLQTIANTFSDFQLQKTYTYFTTPQQSNQNINYCVNSLNFLSNSGLDDIDKVKEAAEFITEKTTKTISKTSQKIKGLLSKMQTHLSQLNIIKVIQNLNKQDQQSLLEKKNLMEDDQKDNQLQTQAPPIPINPVVLVKMQNDSIPKIVKDKPNEKFSEKIQGRSKSSKKFINKNYLQIF